jgi:hypothetical protein
VLADAARRWFQRFRRTDDLYRLVHLATGTSIDLTRHEFDAVRWLLADQQTWVKLGKRPVEDLATWITDFLPPRDGRTANDSHAAALVITRGLLEFAVADLEPKTFQKVLLARLMRIEAGQASILDRVLFDFHSDLFVRLDPDWAGQLQPLRYTTDAGSPTPPWLERQPEGGEDVISQVAWRPSRRLLLQVAGMVAGLSMAALVLLLVFTMAGAGGTKSASAASQAMRGLMDFHLDHRRLLELFITLAAEASNPDHPAREFIQQRYRDTIAEWSGHLRLARDRGEVAGMTDEQIDGEIQSLLAMADGLELQWLLNPQIELPGRFNAYLDQAIHRWQEAP